MDQLKVGFSRVDITPNLGIAINGYFIPRKAEKVLDPLQVNALALQSGETKTVLMTVDNLGINQILIQPMLEAVCAATGLPAEAV